MRGQARGPGRNSVPRNQHSITGEEEAQPRCRGQAQEARAGEGQASQPAWSTPGPPHFRSPLSPHDNIMNESLCWLAGALWGFSAPTQLPRSTVHTALGQAAEIVCGASSETQASGPHKCSQRPRCPQAGPARMRREVPLPLPAPGPSPATLWSSQTLKSGHEHIQGKVYPCRGILYAI